MPVPPEVDRFLSSAGYTYHCFVSWTQVQNDEHKAHVKLIKSKIHDELTFSFSRPRVFLDLDDLPAGGLLEQEVPGALCRSLTMVAVCTSMYYNPMHPWPGREFAAMDALAKMRLDSQHASSIIPLLVRADKNLPPIIQQRLAIDVSKLQIRGGYLHTDEFRKQLKAIVERIEAVAEAVAKNGARPDCDSFQFPASSAFARRAPQEQAYPVTGKPT